MSASKEHLTDTLDLADLARSIGLGWRWIATGAALGVMAAFLVIAYMPARFDSSATAIIRSSSEGGSGLLARLGDGGGGAAALLGASVSSPIETDVQILLSRAVIGAVVDSLLLQAEVRSPRTAATSVVTSLRLPGSFKHIDMTLERASSGAYHYHTASADGTVTPGKSLQLPIGVLVLARNLPDKLVLRLRDREEAIVRTAKALTVSKAGGEVLRVNFSARDSLTAAAVPNGVLTNYLARRKTEDRGLNAHRAEFLLTELDSTSRLQADAEDALRRFQERSGLLDAQVVGKLELEDASELRKNIGALEVEQGALDQLLAQVAAGRMTPRQLIAYPSFLKSSGINDLLRQLAELETERTKLLERRLETDDQVVALTKSIAGLESQLVPLASAYAGALQRQRGSLSAQLSTLAGKLSQFPGGAETSARLLREVVRLNQLTLALQAQLVQARLSAISEGGDVRALDRAVPPREPVFPDPGLTTVLGLATGLIFGLVAALLAGAHGRYVQGTGAIERLLGVPAVRLTPGVPLLVSDDDNTRTLLLIPIDDRAATEDVAARLAEHARARGASALVIDLSRPTRTTIEGDGPDNRIEAAEAVGNVVIVRLPGLSSESTAVALRSTRPVLLVASGDKVNRRALTGALDVLRRLNVPCLGVVLADPQVRASLAAG